MQIRNYNKSLILFTSIALICVFAVMPSMAQEKIKIAGKLTNTVSESYMINIADMEDHALNISKSEGINVSTGEKSFMDSSSVVNYNSSDLIKGNGMHHGYIMLSKEDATVIAKWKGKVTTTTSSDNKPIITFEGTFTYTKGTGPFEKIQGNGTYKGMYISEKEYITEWEGEYFIE
jgi:hypothetical protein